VFSEISTCFPASVSVYIAQVRQTATFSCESDSSVAVFWDFKPTSSPPSSGISLYENPRFATRLLVSFKITERLALLSVLDVKQDDAGTYTCADVVSKLTRAQAHMMVLGELADCSQSNTAL